MKTFFTLIVGLFSGVLAFAADHRESSISIRVPNSSIKVEVDQRTYLSEQGEVFLHDIQPGLHKVVLYREKVSRYGWNKRTAREIILQRSIVVDPGTSVIMDVDRYARVTISQQKSYNNRRNGQYGDDRYDNDRDSHGGYSDGRDDYGRSYSRAIASYDFDRAIEMIKRERYEDNRMKSAQQLIRTNFFTTWQVGELMDLFFADDNKLAVAKMAYEKTVDTEKYDNLKTKISRTDNRREFDRIGYTQRW